MVYFTGDTHGEFSRFSNKVLSNMGIKPTKDDVFIICGDFGGIWDDSAHEHYWLKWLLDKPFTVAFVDGNHENFDRLNALPVTEKWGGKVHKVQERCYHLMRNQFYTIQGYTMFTFGGARSHDISGGIVQEVYKDERGIKMAKLYFPYGSPLGFQNSVCRYSELPHMAVRFDHKSWWKEEMPSEEELAELRRILQSGTIDVDFIVTHCAATNIANRVTRYRSDSDKLSEIFRFVELSPKSLKYKMWCFGHYHTDTKIGNKMCFYNKVVSAEALIDKECTL